MEDKITGGKEVKGLRYLNVRRIISVDIEITNILRVVVESESKAGDEIFE